MYQAPHAAVFENQIVAEATASIRNCLMIRMSGEDVQVDAVLDWYRRDNSGEPMPAEWRDVVGKVQDPMASQKPSGEKAAEQVPLMNETTVQTRSQKGTGA